jgi:hypothetical protein
VAEVYPNTERLIAGLSGVRAFRRKSAEEIGVSARARLAAHRETGGASIVVEHSELDSDVILDDPAALSIEFGRGQFTRADGRTIGAMEGLHILSGALDDVG